MWDTIKAGGEWQGEFQNKKKSGESYWEFAQISPVTNNDGVTTYFIKLAEDITALKEDGFWVLDA
jgi:PAS domain-containing protein